jgi:hypothetical protein
MHKLTLTIACRAYDRVRALIHGTVTIEGCNVIVLPFCTFWNCQHKDRQPAVLIDQHVDEMVGFFNAADTHPQSRLIRKRFLLTQSAHLMRNTAFLLSLIRTPQATSVQGSAGIDPAALLDEGL